MNAKLINFQEDGFVPFSKHALSEANRMIAAAKNATPMELRDAFRSYIRFSGVGAEKGYIWGWVLK